MSTTIIGCPIDAALQARVADMIKTLREAPDTVSRETLIALILELTDASFQYHFVRPLKPLGIGFATRKSIDVGLMGAMRVIRSSMQRVINAMEAERFARIADFLEDAYFPARDTD